MKTEENLFFQDTVHHIEVHRTRTFEKAYLALFKKHGNTAHISTFDEEYLWLHRSYRTLRDGSFVGRFSRHFVPSYDRCCPSSGTKYILGAEALIKLALLGFDHRTSEQANCLARMIMEGRGATPPLVIFVTFCVTFSSPGWSDAFAR